MRTSSPKPIPNGMCVSLPDPSIALHARQANAGAGFFGGGRSIRYDPRLSSRFMVPPARAPSRVSAAVLLVLGGLGGRALGATPVSAAPRRAPAAAKAPAGPVEESLS